MVVSPVFVSEEPSPVTRFTRQEVLSMLNQYREKAVHTAGRIESHPTISLFGTPENIFYYFEIRKHLEINAAILAAHNATNEDIAKLEEHIVLMRNTVRFYHLWEKSTDQFHRSITEATHSALYTHLITTLHDLFRITVHSTLRRVAKNRIGLQHDIVDQYEAIASAIGNHNASMAGNAAESHLDYVENVWKRTLGIV